MKVIGIILIVVGILMMVFNGFNFTTQQKVADVGPLQINKEQNHSASWPTYTGGIILIAGVVVTVVGFSRKKA